MRLEELRVGNWIKYKDNYLLVTEISSYMICSDNWGFDNFEDIHPIPLTPEILEKAGFEKDIYYKPALKHYNWHYLLTAQNDNVWLLWAAEYNELPFRLIYSVHQLQTLFYALCGEELNVKL